MNMDVRAWLKSLGLGDYAVSFEENCIDGQVLMHLTADDLRDIGVIAVGHRRRLLKAIAALQTTGSTAKQPRQEAADTLASEPNAGERRQVTVLFADICGFTNLTASIDSEEVHALLAGYFEVADAIIRDFGGSVDKHVGDSVMAVFGAPISHGNDAERALRAAIAIQEAMPAVSERSGRMIEAHIGIASGEVVASGVGPDSHYTVIGDSVNLASRLTDKAQAGEVYVSAEVRHSVMGTVEDTDLGEIPVKGLVAPVRVYSVRRITSPKDGPLDRPFVGRNAEIRQFRIALEVCKESGRGQLIQIRGDAGIGKTRLTHEFSRLAAEQDFVCHRSLILDFGVGKGQDPVRALVRSFLGLLSGDDVETRRAAAEVAVSEGLVTPAMRLHLNDLLDLPQSAEAQATYDAMDNLTRNLGKRETVTALARNLSARDRRLIVFEDLHWADKLVLQCIVELGRGAAEAPILIVVTSRAEGDPLDAIWRGSVPGTPFMTLDLGPLSRADALSMAAGLADTAGKFAHTCIDRAAGNPLFLEQLMRSAVAGAAQIPGSVQSIVQARLDRLPATDKLAVQAASVLGQRFSLDALRNLIDDSRYDCAELVTHHLIREQDEGYLFDHALVRDGVYGSLLRSRRNALHLKAAAWFAASDLPLRAEHLEQAGHPDAAEAFFDAAHAQWTALRLDHACRLAERGLALEAGPETVFELNCLHGELLRELGEPERSIKAFSEALAVQAGDTQKCRALLGIAEGMRIVERIDDALGLLAETQPLAEAEGMTEALMRLHHLRGNLLFPKGDIAGCEAGHRESIRYAKEIGAAEGEARGLGGLGDAAYVAGRMRTSHDMLSRCVELCREHGYRRTEVANAAQVCHTKLYKLEIREALAQGRATIEAARHVGHDRAELNAGAACLFATVELSEWSEAEAHAVRVMALAEKLGSSRFGHETLAFYGVVLHATGRTDDALDSIRQAIREARTLGLSFGGPRIFGRLICVTDDRDEQDAALAEAEEVIAQGCVGHNQPNFYRDAIEIMLGRRDWDEVHRYADSLAAFPQEESLPWSEFFVSRARALAAVETGTHDENTIARLQSLRDQALRIGLVAYLPSLETALGIDNPPIRAETSTR